MSATRKFVLVLFDGLRRDIIKPDLAPNLCQFLAEGSDFPLSRSVFPTSTRVNAAALATGTVSGTHGIVANEFYDPKVFPDRLVSTGKISDIESIATAYGGRPVTARSLGEVAADAGLRVVVVSTGTAGTTRLAKPMAKELGQVSLCLRAWKSSTPADFARSTIETFGSIPPAARPNVARIRMKADLQLKTSTRSSGICWIGGAAQNLATKFKFLYCLTTATSPRGTKLTSNNSSQEAIYASPPTVSTICTLPAVWVIRVGCGFPLETCP